MWFVQDYGIFLLLERSPYSPVLELLCLYHISGLKWWTSTTISYGTTSNFYTSGKRGAGHPDAEARKMEPVYSNNVLTGSCKRRLLTKTFIYHSDPIFHVYTITYVERRVRDRLMLLANIVQAQIEARMWLNRCRPAEALDQTEAQPLKTT